MKRALFTIAVICSVGVITAGCLLRKAPPANTPVANVNSADSQRDMIRVTAPVADSIVTSPLTITGEARGTWYFEASFPIEILDANNVVIGNGFAQAQGEWMTENFVPFIATVTFVTPETNTGTILLKKDNPSGLPEYDRSVNIPVTFGKNQTPVTIFLGNETLNPNAADCTKVFPVTHVVPKTQAVARAALEQLIAGPTPGERLTGFYTSVNPGTTIQKLIVDKGVATVDFSGALEWWSGGSCKVGMIRAQITETLKQFPTVTEVVISVNGKTEGVLEP